MIKDPTDELIQRLRAVLSWKVAPKADNPAFQAYLEIQRTKDPLYHINPLAAHSQEYKDLFQGYEFNAAHKVTQTK